MRRASLAAISSSFFFFNSAISWSFFFFCSAAASSSCLRMAASFSLFSFSPFSTASLALLAASSLFLAARAAVSPSVRVTGSSAWGQVWKQGSPVLGSIPGLSGSRALGLGLWSISSSRRPIASSEVVSATLMVDAAHPAAAFSAACLALCRWRAWAGSRPIRDKACVWTSRACSTSFPSGSPVGDWPHTPKERATTAVRASADCSRFE
mmetsp:Transcript_60841/g.108596  ORF Transcript_60841/g.108596 Transcript_60841/m.108596 type:complete len:209 (+) Transcript_60841:378-1004(+)